VGGALPPGRLVGLYHAIGDITDCALLEVSFASGANRTIAKSSACASLATNFPAFSASDGTSLLVAINSAPAVLAINIDTGDFSPLGGLPPSNDTFPLLGMVWMPQTGALTATALGLYNSTAPGEATQLVAFTGPEVLVEAFVVASYPFVYLVDEDSSSITAINVADGFSKKTLSGLANPIGTVVLDASTLLQERSYQLYKQPLAGGKAVKVMSLPDGPGYPRQNGIATGRFWWFFDFADLHVCDLTAKTSEIVGGGFVAAPRSMGVSLRLASTRNMHHPSLTLPTLAPYLTVPHLLAKLKGRPRESGEKGGLRGTIPNYAM